MCYLIHGILIRDFTLISTSNIIINAKTIIFLKRIKLLSKKSLLDKINNLTEHSQFELNQ